MSARTLREEVLPVRDTVLIANRKSRRHRAWRHGLHAQAETGLVREAVGLARIHVAVREHAIVPRRRATARTRDNVVDVPLVASQLAPGVLADAAVSFPNPARAEPWSSQRHSRVIHRDDHRGHTDRATRA